MSIAPVTFDASKGMLANGLPSFVIMRILFDVIIIDVHRILVLTSLDNAFGKFGALVF